MEAKRTRDCVKKLFQGIVSQDSNDKFLIGFGFIQGFPPLPQAMLQPKKDSSCHGDQNSTFVQGGRGGVTSFTNITGRVPTLLTATVLWIGAITKKQLDKVKRKLQQFDVVFCNLLKGIKVVKRFPFGTWYRKLCGEAGLEGSIIRNKMRMRHLTSGTVIVWLLIVVNWWNMNSLEQLDLIPWYGLKWCG